MHSCDPGDLTCAFSDVDHLRTVALVGGEGLMVSRGGSLVQGNLDWMYAMIGMVHGGDALIVGVNIST